MPAERTWQGWLERLYNLHRVKSGLRERPHKPVLLRAILDLLDCGLLTKNEIRLTPGPSDTAGARCPGRVLAFASNQQWR